MMLLKATYFILLKLLFVHPVNSDKKYETFEACEMATRKFEEIIEDQRKKLAEVEILKANIQGLESKIQEQLIKIQILEGASLRNPQTWSSIAVNRIVGCDEGWSHYGGKCYRAIVGKMSKYQADNLCRSMYNAELAVPTDHYTNAFIHHIWFLSGGTRVGSYWIGVRKFGNEWVLPNSTKVSYTNWRSEPRAGWDCAIVGYENNLSQWDGTYCTDTHLDRHHYGAMCQKDDGKSNGGIKRCDEGWSHYDDKCYRPVIAKVTYPEAAALCRDVYKAELAVPTNVLSNLFMKNVWIQNHGDKFGSYWIGIIKSAGVWTTPNLSKALYTNWRLEPKAHHDCAVVNHRNIDGHWDGATCTHSSGDHHDGAMCQRVAIKRSVSIGYKRCDEGWSKFNNMCYRANVTIVEYEQASRHCESLNAHVAVPTDSSSNEFITYIWHYSGGRTRPFWIGIRKLGSSWALANGQTAQYTNWREGESGGCCRLAANCVIVNYSTEHPGKWDDSSCGDERWRYGTVCQKEAM